VNTHAALSNLDLRDEIKAYWSQRAETFDSQPGHEIFSEEERAAWHALLRRHLGEGSGRAALDLACGTAVVSHLLDDLGFRVTGMDWAEPMLENTMEPEESYDVITNRHLVWTLVDPRAAFREWHRLLKPAGRLLVVDGDFVNPGPVAKAVRRLSALLARIGIDVTGAAHGPSKGEMAATHQSILARVHFSKGARAEAVVELLKEAGFSKVTIDTDMRAIHRTQRKNFSFLKGLERATQHRYAICAEK
jgi:ubiquinone/menaquinone biosynthesis C-methylase UbiE